jgi:hypothetical protein
MSPVRAKPLFLAISSSTPLHRSIRSTNEAVFSILLAHSELNLELQTSDGETALWLALQVAGTSANDQSPDSFYSDQSFAVRLIKRGASPDAINPDTGR